MSCKKPLLLTAIMFFTLFTPTANAGWTDLTYDDFESGWGNYTPGGGDCLLYTDGTYAHQGSNAADIQDDSVVASSFYHTNGIDVDTPGYTQLKVEFWYIPISMDNSKEDFWLQYYDGTDWNTVETWVQGTDFENGNPYNPTVYIDEASYAFPTDMKIRFMCDASGNRDDVYIDEIRVSAYIADSPPGQASSPSPADSATDVSIDADLTWTAGSDATSHDVYFGTTSPGTFQGNQTTTTFDLGTMAYDTTYYWRIDEINATGTTTGTVWSFTTETDTGGVELLVNTGFESGSSPWYIGDANQITVSNEDPHDGSSSAKFVGNDTWLLMSQLIDPAQEGVTYDVSSWMKTVSVTTQGEIWLQFLDSGWAIISESLVGSATGSTAYTQYSDSLVSPTGTAILRVRLVMPNGTGTIYYDDLSVSEAGAGAPGQASNPSPADSATGVSIDADLSWTAGTGSTSSDVYFGTTSPGAFQGNQTATTFDPGTLANDTIYYWRIDEINAAGTTTGSVWSFTTIVAGPGQANNPSPADSATDIGVDTDLSWTAGSGATSHDVYFGTSSPGTFQGNQTAATFDTGTMANETTYYWRIDEINAGGTTAGTVWSFTTIVALPGQTSNPNPADTATDIDINADLSWTGGAGATSYNVYFGTEAPAPYQGNQTATTFDPGTMANSTTYYWRVDSVNEAGASGGVYWSFTTEAAGPPLPGPASNPNPANGATNVDINANLSWIAGSNATSHDVYFGTSSPGSYQGNQTATTFDTSTMANDTTYYWRIDEVNVTGTTTGTVWNFTTIVAAPGQADFPTPTNAATDVSVDADLTWVAGSGATSHDVYFGTSSPGSYQGNQTTTTFDPGTMANDTTYYWRIDEVNAGGTTAGTVWLFTTIVAAPGQASSPSPADSATDIAVDADLSWVAGSGATSRDVYFGTSSPGTFQGNQAATTFDTGTMANNTTYYWHIDEVNAGGTTAGSVWSFTTIVGASGQASNPSPADSATDIAVDADLSWTAGSGATSHDVYFGTSSPGSFQGNQTATTFNPGTMANDTTYYWRIDEVNAGGTTTGNVWSFTTIVAAPGQASSPSPADSATSVSIGANLSWTAGSGATSHDVYFGTSSPGTFQVNQTATTFEPGTMANETTYYWRIDELNAAGTTTGAVWSFTTEEPIGGEELVINPGFESGINPWYITDANYCTASTDDPHSGLYSGKIEGANTWLLMSQLIDPAQEGVTYYVSGWLKTVNVMTYAEIWLQFLDSGYGIISETEIGQATGSTSYTQYSDSLVSPTGTAILRVRLIFANGTGTAYFDDISVSTVDTSGYASNPNPADAAVDVLQDAVLSWTPGAYVAATAGHELYLGTDFDDVNNSDPSVFIGALDTNSYNPGGLSYDTTYYWAVDEVNGVDTWYGDVWSFTTEAMLLPGQAGNPSPADSATDVSIDVDLSWTAGSGSTSSDVYFGTSSPGSYRGNQTATTFDLGTMANDTTYYWRIDEVNAAGTTTGVVWSFTTIVAEPSQASNPNPANGATNIAIDVDLSWTAGSGSTSSDVYFGTSSPGSYQGNQMATTFDTGTMANDTTYYWRIDEISAGGTTTGTVWSFTTIVGLPDQTSNPNPADYATGVSVDADLSWTGGAGATSYNVYFDTVAPAAYQGNVTSTTFDPGTMANDTTYYWRIDSVNEAGARAGTYWEFTTESAAPTPPGQASNPSPADSATDINITADLSWSAGSGATSHDVYFGTSSPGSFQGNQTATTFDPGAMAEDTVYYWRIDEVNAQGTTTGVVWNFTTVLTGQSFYEPMAYGDINSENQAGLYCAPKFSSLSDLYPINTRIYATKESVTDGVGLRVDYLAGAMGGFSMEIWELGGQDVFPPGSAGLTMYAKASSNITLNINNAHQFSIGTTWQKYDIPWSAFGGTPENPSIGGWQFDMWLDSTPTEDGWYIIDRIGSESPDFITNPSISEDTRPDITINTADIVGEASVLAPTVTRLNQQQPFTIYAFGDSVTAGSQANRGNWWIDGNDVPDYLYFGHLERLLEARYGYSGIDYVQLGYGGWTSAQAMTVVAADLASAQAEDVVIIEFGANDLFWVTSTSQIQTWLDNTANLIAEAKTHTSQIIITSPTLGGWHIIDFEDEISSMMRTFAAAQGVAYVDVTHWMTYRGALHAWASLANDYHPDLMGHIMIAEIMETLFGAPHFDWPQYETAASAPAQASNPSPADSSTGVSVDADLSWTAGTGSTSSDVYFGTSSPGSFQGNQTATTFDPGVLANDTTYYWRIDEINAVGTTTGNVWSFTTITSGGTGTGLTGDYYDNIDFTGFVLSRVDATVNFNWGTGSPDPSIGADTFSVRWTGQVEPLYSETYTFYTTSDDGVRLWVDSQLVVDNWTDHGPTENSGTIALTAGVKYDIQMDFYENGGGAVAELRWSSASQTKEIIPQSQLYESAGPTPPGQASSPSPGNGATDVSVDADISWSAGSAATSHDVYFGTSSPGSFQGNQTATTFDPGTMANDTAYYWRIDEVNSSGTTTGTVWSFTTESGAPSPPGQASNPSPANSATSVSINADLSWTAGSGSTSSNVYFGKSSPGTYQGNQTATTYDTGTMANDTTYYWRIDEVNSSGTTTGNVWNFTTAPDVGGDKASNPSPSNGTTGVSITAKLQWQAGSGSTSSDVYFGTTSPGDFQVNQVGVIFDPGALDNNTTYYWRIDEVSNSGTTVGNVWSFTTEVTTSAGPGILGWWKFDESSGTTAADSSGYGNTALLDDDPNSDPQWVTGKIGNALYFDGNHDYGLVTCDPNFFDITGQITLSAWITLDYATNYATVISKGQETAWELQTASYNERISFHVAASGMPWNGISGPTNVGGSVWHHIAGVYDGSMGYVYIDGVEDVQQAASGPIGINNDDVVIGGSAPSLEVGWRHWEGMMDDVRVYDRALSPEEIADLAGFNYAIASNPNPPNGATDVEVSSLLMWTPGGYATSHDVYFGTTRPGDFQGNETSAMFSPGLLEYDTTYYWSITEVNSPSSWAGDVWSFTTESAPQAQGPEASSPRPADGLSTVSTGIHLKWMQGTDATSHDVYFGTSSPGTFQGNQISTVFDPGALNEDTTYYWRIDELSPGGTTTGDVWSFTTTTEETLLLTSIETQNDITNDWTAETGSMSLSNRNVTEGDNCLQINYGQVAPRFEYARDEIDISGYDKLEFDVYLEGTQMTLTGKFWDVNWNSYTSFYYLLRPGHTTVEYNIAGLASKLDTTRFNRMLLFTDETFTGDEQATIYIDNVRVTRGSNDDGWLKNLWPGEPIIIDPDTIVPNGDFELGMHYWGSWGQFDGGDYLFSGATGENNAKSGQYSMSIICLTEGRGGFYGVDELPLEAGDWELRYWARGSEPGVEMRHNFVGGALSGQFYSSTFSVPTTWTEYTYSFTANSATSSLLYFFAEGIGTLYVDAVSCTKAGVPGYDPGQAQGPPRIVTTSQTKTLVDGSAYFPIGIYGGEPSVLGPTSMNTLTSVDSSHHMLSILDDCETYGLMALPALTGVARGHVPENAGIAVNHLKNHPAVLCWYNCDEPDHNKWNVPPPEIRFMSQKIAEVDVNHPSSVLVMPWASSNMYQYADTVDIYMSDVYEWNMWNLTDQMDVLRDSAGPDKPVWMILRAFAEGTDPEPTSDYVYCSTYAALAHTADGVIWFSYEYCQSHPNLWNAVQNVAAELETLSPALVSDTSPIAVTDSHFNVHTIMKEYNGNLYLIAVNIGDAATGVQITIPGATATQADVWFESRTVPISSGVITDDFGYRERHVYVFPAP